jgi:hypothetical protein
LISGRTAQFLGIPLAYPDLRIYDSLNKAPMMGLLSGVLQHPGLICIARVSAYDHMTRGDDDAWQVLMHIINTPPYTMWTSDPPPSSSHPTGDISCVSDDKLAVAVNPDFRKELITDRPLDKTNEIDNGEQIRARYAP